MEKLARLPNFIKRFGPVHGLRLGLGLESAGGGDVTSAPNAVSVPGYASELWLRPTRSDYSIFWQCVVQGQYDFAQFPQMAELHRRAEAMQHEGAVPVIVDGGGNIGLAALGFARDFPFAQIVTVEPDADNFAVLQRNVAAVPAITPVQGAVASCRGYSRVIAQERGSAGLMTEFCDADAVGAVPAWTIPDLVGMVPGGRPWIVKLDIEGAQHELFSANLNWIGSADLIVLEPDDWAFPWSGSTVNFLRALAPYRFDYLLHGELILCFRHLPVRPPSDA